VASCHTGAFGALAAIHQPMTLILGRNRRRGIPTAQSRDQRLRLRGSATQSRYIDTKEAIKQRYVDLNQVAIY